jgi:hypothetical protein
MLTGGSRYTSKALVAITAYSLLVVFIEKAFRSRAAYRIGAVLGALGGALQIIHMSLESFGSHLGDTPWVTVSLMGLTFVVWAFAAVLVVLGGAPLREAVLAAALSGIVTMIIAVVFGLSLVWAGYPEAGYVATWSEFRRSGWSDARCFAVANSFDALISHFVGGPLVGSVVGLFGGLIATLLRKPNQEHS